MGSPGIGKSTFIKEYIHPRNFNLKVFSTDDVSLTFTKDPNIYYPQSSDLNINKLFNFIKTGNGFIYDTTGNSKENITNIFNTSKSMGYTIIFIHLIGSLEMAKLGNKSRERNVDDDYLVKSLMIQNNLMKLYSKLNPDNYYIVKRINSNKYSISKFQ